MIHNEPIQKMRLRHFSLPVRLCIAAFLISLGLGYLAAMVQMHFQHATQGQAMPTLDDIVARFSGVTRSGFSPEEPKSKMLRLVEAPENLPLNGGGQMSTAFFKRSDDWDESVEKHGEPLARSLGEGEQKALAAWLRAGAKQDTYDADRFPLPAGVEVVTEKYLLAAVPKAIKIKSLIEDRCANCHYQDGLASKFRLETFEQISKYTQIPPPGSDPAKSRQISRQALVQSTHVHMLSFSMLYLISGLIFALTSYPGWMKLILAPLPLVFQMLDISCWWLARLDGVGPTFAMLIMFTGGVVGMSVAAQIILSLMNLFGHTGRAILVFLALFGAVGGYFVQTKVLGPMLDDERKLLEESKPKEPVK